MHCRKKPRNVYAKGGTEVDKLDVPPEGYPFNYWCDAAIPLNPLNPLVAK